jgi:hypothetical protein
VFVDGLSEWVVRSPNEVYGLMQRGSEQVGWARGAAVHGLLLGAAHVP